MFYGDNLWKNKSKSIGDPLYLYIFLITDLHALRVTLSSNGI